MVLPNKAPLASSGVISLKTIPGFGKLGMSRMAVWILAISSLIFAYSPYQLETCNLHPAWPSAARGSPTSRRFTTIKPRPGFRVRRSRKAHADGFDLHRNGAKPLRISPVQTTADHIVADLCQPIRAFQPNLSAPQYPMPEHSTTEVDSAADPAPSCFYGFQNAGAGR